MKHLLCVLAFLLLGLGLAPSSHANDEKAEPEALSLEDILNLKTNLASGKALTTRESPAVITILSREEIQAVGARDMIDVLMLVPGFNFCSDVWGLVGLSFRGFYGIGEKVMVDGAPWDERLYGNLGFGNHFPVQQIERVEIIRGPGSVLYGGQAEFAVVNIVMQHGAEIDGVSVAVSDGETGNTFGHRNLNASVGKKFSKDFSIYASTFVGYSHRSDQNYTDNSGISYQMAPNSAINSLFAQLGADYKDASLRLIVDHYVNMERDQYGYSLPYAISDTFDTYDLNAKYPVHITPNFTLTPKVELSRQYPWRVDDMTLDSAGNATESKIRLDQVTANLSGNYALADFLHLTAGLEYYWDTADYDLLADNVVALAPTSDVVLNFHDTSVFAEALWENPYVNVTLGGRYEQHSQAGSSFVPRLVLTHTFDKFHFKAMVDKAYRPPMIEALRISPNILPENALSTELEVGYMFSPKFFVSANVFDLSLANAVIYQFDATGAHYVNAGNTETQGFELEGKYRDSWGFLTANYSFYRVAASDITNSLPVDYNSGNLFGSNTMLGLPQHKITAAGSFKVWNRLSVGPTLIWMSTRTGYSGLDSNQNPIPVIMPPAILLHIFAHYDDLFIKGLSLGAGIYNLANTANAFGMGYSSLGKPALPDLSREYLFQLAYRYQFGSGS